MNFNINENKEVLALLGAGSMGIAIAKRMGIGKIILLGDVSEENLKNKAEELRYGGYIVETQIVNALDNDSVEKFAKKAVSLGSLKYFIDTAGASPNQATPEQIINLDLIATSYAIDIFSKYIAKGGSGLIISSQTGYMYPLTIEEENELSNTPSNK